MLHFLPPGGGQGRQEGSDYIYIYMYVYIYMKLLLNRKHDFFRTPHRAIQLLGDPTRMNDRTGHEFAQVQETKKMVMHLLTTAMTLPWVEDLQSASMG